MSTTTVVREISAPVSLVFETVARIDNFSQAVSHITDVVFLTEQKYGVGTRFRETRTLKGKSQSTELEVTELVEGEHIRLVSDQGGTIWDTVFTVEPIAETAKPGEVLTRLTLVMDAKAYRLAAKLFNPLIKGMIAKFIGQDMDAVKSYCENRHAGT
jgi:carbon monoxide dehydrogenase subunit G